MSIVHATVHACVDDLSPEIIGRLEPMRRARHGAVERKPDSLRAVEVLENSGGRTGPAPVRRGVFGMRRGHGEADPGRIRSGERVAVEGAGTNRRYRSPEVVVELRIPAGDLR